MTKITVAKRDGFRPKMMEATLKILNVPAKQLDIEDNVIVEKMYLNDNIFGVANTHKLGNTQKLTSSQSFVNGVFL